MGLHRTGPCLVSQVIEGGAGLRMWLGVWGPFFLKIKVSHLSVSWWRQSQSSSEVWVWRTGLQAILVYGWDREMEHIQSWNSHLEQSGLGAFHCGQATSGHHNDYSYTQRKINFANLHANISRVSDQNGISLQWYIVETCHSGRKPFICYIATACYKSKCQSLVIQ